MRFPEFYSAEQYDFRNDNQKLNRLSLNQDSSTPLGPYADETSAQPAIPTQHIAEHRADSDETDRQTGRNEHCHDANLQRVSDTMSAPQIRQQCAAITIL